MPRFLRSRLAVALLIASTGAAGLAAVPVASAAPVSSVTASSAPAAAPAIADDRLLVTVDPTTTEAQAQTIAAAAGATIEDRSGDTLILVPVPGSASATLRSASASLANRAGVRAVEPNIRLVASATPNDSYWADQYGLGDSQPGGIRAQSAWNTTRGSRDVVVGVLDSGVALNHPDLTANLWTNRTGVGGCAYGTHGYNAIERTCTPFDDDGHGTHVAGIVGATGDNGRGVTGVAQRVSIMPLRMLSGTLCEDGPCGSTADAIRAIDWAVNARNSGVNVRVLQASWGAPTSNVSLSAAIGRANSAGILFVTAAGNGVDNDGVPVDLDGVGVDEFPCEDGNANVICVAATNQLDVLAAFSNYGAAAVDIAAPGFHILSTTPPGFFDCPDPSYCEFDGTSMAAPMVSGAAVDIIATEPAISVTDLKARILASVDTPPALSGKVATGGRLNVCKAMPNCDGRPVIAPTVPTNVQVQVGDGSAKVSWAAPDSNGNSFTVIGYDVEGPNGLTSHPLTTTTATLTGLTNNQNATVRVRAVNNVAPGPWATVTIRPYAGGFEVDGLGRLHAVGVGGKKPTGATGGPSFAADLARGVAILPTGTGGYVVDAYGGVHRFRIGSTSPLPPVTTGGPYWPGWNIVRGIALSPSGGGYVLDGYGGMHTFGFGAAAPPAKAKNGPYWNGFDIARGVTFTADGKGGYVVDAYGGTHPFANSGANPPRTTGGPYWPGWNIVRGITLAPGGGGWILDGFGGPHRFATNGQVAPPPTGSPYWPGWDIARGVDL
jgi:subtilisin family serine protease